MDKRQKSRYFLAIYVVVAFIGFVAALIGQNSDDEFWKSILLNLSTELFGVVIIFFIVNFFFLGDEWDLAQKVTTLTERLELIEQSVNRNFLEKLSNQQQKDLERKLKDANSLLIIGVALDRTLEEHQASMRQILKRGGRIRVVLEKPSADNSALLMTVKRRFRNATVESWINRIDDNLSDLSQLRQATQGRLEVGLTDYHLSRGSIVVDHDSLDGILFTWLYSFQVEAENQPKFILYPQDKWHKHFLKEAEKIWSDADKIEL